MSKRKREFLLCDEPPDFKIEVADKEVPIQVHSEILRLYSEVARNVIIISGSQPAGEDAVISGKKRRVWDLRNVVLEGESQPVKGATVELWLDCLYSFADSSRRLKLPSGLNDAKSLLLFASYAGTVEVVQSKIARALCDDPQLSLTVPVGDQGRSVDLLLRDRIYYAAATGELHEVRVPRGSSGPINLLPSAEFQPHQEQFASALSSLLEEWLELAGRLGLVPLVERLLEFVRRLLFPANLSVVLSCVASIFSPRVLQAMPKQIMFDAFLRHNLGCRPSEVVFVDASGLKANLRSPNAAAWFGSSTLTASFAPVPDGGPEAGMRMTASGTFIPSSVSIGGLDPEDSVRAVKEALAKAPKEE